MGYAEKLPDGTYRGRYKIAAGKYGTVKDERGGRKRFRTKRDAVKAANDEEAKVSGGEWSDPAAGRLTFGAWVAKWYAAQNLALSTMQNLRHHIQDHLLPEFEADALADIDNARVDEWEKKELKAGYKLSSVKTWRGSLHVILADAVDGREVDRVLGRTTGGAGKGLIDFNPATKRRNRGKRHGRKRNRGPKKVVIGDLGALLIAERAAILSGRDDEFVAIVLKYFTGLRWGEVVGLETEYAMLGSIRVEWQLWEDDFGVLHRIPPKEDSYRDIDLPPWASGLLSGHIARTGPAQPCPCHGLKHVFRGRGTSAARRVSAQGAGVTDVARAANVSAGTVSNVLNHPDRVREATRLRVEAAIAELGFVPGKTATPSRGAHWRRSGFSTWVFHPAVTGWYPAKKPQPARPVPLLAGPWPGVPVRGRNSAARAEANWMPLAPGLTPHGLRHSHKNLMDEVLTPASMAHDRLGHEMEGIAAVYSQPTADMRERLCEQLTERWETVLAARKGLHPSSPVRVLDELLRSDKRSPALEKSEDRLQKFSKAAVLPFSSRTRNGS